MSSREQGEGGRGSIILSFYYILGQIAASQSTSIYIFDTIYYLRRV